MDCVTRTRLGYNYFMAFFVPYKKELKRNSRELRKNPTESELILWRKVLCRDQLCGYRFLRQKPIGNYIVDFYCSKLRLAIEVDGHTHDVDSKYDKRRTEQLNNLGVEVVRYTNPDVKWNLDGVYEDLMRKVKSQEKLIKIHPRPPLAKEGMTTTS